MVELKNLSEALPKKRARRESSEGDASAKITVNAEDPFADFSQRAKHSKEPHMQHALIVLAAVEEVLKESGAGTTATAYFAALMSSLERQQKESQQSQSETSPSVAVGGICTLLGLLVPRLPAALVRSRFRQVADLLLPVLHTYGEEDASLTKAVLSVVADLLCMQDPSASVWSMPITLKTFRALLQYCTDSRPKVRKKAHALVGQALEALAPHKGALAAAGKVVGKACGDVMAQCTARDTLQTLHVLGLVKVVLPLLTEETTTSMCGDLTRLAYLKLPLVSIHLLHAFQALVELPSSSVSSDSLVQLLQVLQENEQPTSTGHDQDLLLTHLRLVARTYTRLYGCDEEKCSERLPRGFATVAHFLALDSEPVLLAAGECLKGLIKCIGRLMVDKYRSAVSLAKAARAPTPLEKCVAHVESLLKLRYKSAWDVVLLALATLFNQLGRDGHPLLDGLLRSIGALHDSADFHYREQLNVALAAAIASLGPAAILSVLPFEMERPDGSIKFTDSRAWLLPLLRQHVTNAELRFFAETILPMIHRLHTKSVAAADDGRTVEAKNIKIVVHQLWSLLPAFCTYPRDAQEAFRLVAKPAADAVLDPELVPVVCNSMINLINRSREVIKPKENEEEGPSIPPAPMSVELAQQTVAAAGRFAGNYLPILFNLYSSGTGTPPTPLSQEQRSLVLDAITAWISIADPTKVVNPHFKSVIKKLLEADAHTADATGVEAMEEGGEEQQKAAALEKKQRQQVLMDLALAFVQSLQDDNIDFLYRVIKPHLADDDSLLQKKAFKVLSRMCEHHSKWVTLHIATVQADLVASLPACAISSKKTRIRCIEFCISQLSDEALKEFVAAVIAEVMLATKEVAAKCRDAAYSCLIAAARCMRSDSPESGLEHYFNIVSAGLAGSHPHMISATISSLSRLLFDYHGEVQELTATFLKHMLVLLAHKSREVASAAMGFVKVAVAILPPDIVRPHLDDLIDKLCNWSRDTKNHFRVKIRVLFEKLIRKFGFDVVHSLVPEEQKRMIINIRKAKERASRKKAQMTDADKKAAQAAAASRGDAKAKSYSKQHQQFVKTIQGGDNDDEDEADDELFGTSLPRKQGAGAGAGAGAKKSEKGNSKRKMWMREGDEDNPIDLLSADASLRVAVRKPTGQASNGDSGKKRRRFPESEDGKIIVQNEDEDEDEKEPAPKGKRRRSEAGESGSRTEDDYDNGSDKGSDEENEGTQKKQKGQWLEKTKAKNTNARGQGDKGGKQAQLEAHAGDRFKSKKAKGDMKDGRLEPYAYVPLGQKVAKQRGGKGGKGVKNIVNAAKKGASKGDKVHRTMRKTQKKHKG
mmetsp:Transcript_32344/g.52263  ORF Transcript_32344/g.52263 Transcript_32344/m.52263 type:complete len:1330 (-) Transcript_32344:437-4426(-)